ncbi:MAG TPA: gamma-glutamyltransferase family protein [Caulobacteraceae bacterium]|nr:gamma-glutamyltransferase family protein [Caulobacteraceae bacterium]
MRIAPFAAATAFMITAALGACTAAPQNQAAQHQPGEQPSIAANPVKPAAEWRLEGRAMVSAADKRAVDAALEAMRQGGSAVDAAIAAHAVLGLVEPQSSGLGGGGYMVVYDRASNTTTVIDGREAAPATATADYFTVDGTNLGFIQAIQSGKSVGAPGTIALYKAAHEKFGKRAWDANFQAAIKLADEGFIVSPRLANSLGPRFQNGPLGKNPASAAYFFPNGKPLAVGDRRTNSEYAATLRAVATQGPAAFYSGSIAEDIVEAVRAGDIPGELSLKDLADYEALVRPAICGPYKDYTICSAPPSSSGGVAMNLIMSLYEDISARSGASTEEARLRDFVIAQQLGYADRDHYIADPAAVSVPVAGLLDPAYIKARATSGFKPGEAPQPGDPGAVLNGQPIRDIWGRDINSAQPGTTHMSFVDFDGNAVSFTATVEGPFGSSRWTNGFLLNNELTDFTRPPVLNGKPVANAPGPGKRPRSSMSPTIVFDKQGDVFMVTGSPGGNSIVGYVSKTLVAVLDWGKTAQEASALPNVVARGPIVSVETANDTGKAWAKALADAGFRTREVAGENSGLNLIVAREDTFEGGADPRREGVAIEIVR